MLVGGGGWVVGEEGGGRRGGGGESGVGKVVKGVGEKCSDW